MQREDLAPWLNEYKAVRFAAVGYRDFCLHLSIVKRGHCKLKGRATQIYKTSSTALIWSNSVITPI